LVVNADQELSNYYRVLIPKWKNAKSQMYPAHITVVREGLEEPKNLEFWGKYQGEKIEFYYSPEVQEGTVYFWLNIFSVRLEEIRIELGLSVHSEYTLPPEGFTKCFHMTVGNKKCQ
jgi:hypothetical protein